MPKETRMTAEKLAVELCEQEGFDVKDASEFAEDMTHYFLRLNSLRLLYSLYNFD